MAAPGAAPSPQTRALFDALLTGDTETALALLQGPDATQLAHTGPAGFTSLHAAVAGRGADALAALVAAGAPQEGELTTNLFYTHWPDQQCIVVDQLRCFLSAGSTEALQGRCKSMTHEGRGFTPLALAVRQVVAQLGGLKDAPAARQLLDLGADPTAGLYGLTGLGDVRKGHVAPGVRQMLNLLLQRGANCLRPFPTSSSSCLALYGWSGLQAPLLAHLERQHAAGSLQLGSKAEVCELLTGAVRAGHRLLASHALGCLEQRLGAAHTGPQAAVAPADARLLGQLLFDALIPPSSKAVPTLQLLLGSPLPFVASALAHVQCQLLGSTAAHSRAVCESILPLLQQAGAPLTTADLLLTVHAGSSRALAALLAYGAPAVDMHQPDVLIRTYCHAYSCPIHELLRQSARRYAAPRPWEAARMLELLLQAGYRPTTYRNVVPPPFLGRGSAVLATLDPFDFHPASLDQRLVFLARGGTWSRAEHHRWPDAFKAATRTLLLAGSAAGEQPVAEAAAGSSKRRRRRGRAAGDGPSPRGGMLAALPAGALLRVIELAAAPMSAWL
ncbi:hypothetical protein ABPG75_006647 [Micractinium tetrahymenae]